MLENMSNPTVCVSADGSSQLVGIGPLRVVIVPDGDLFFAQGLEIDYSATGDSIENVKVNFERGLRRTIGEHLSRPKGLAPFIQPAPPSVWKELLYCDGAISDVLWQVSKHKIADDVDLPFSDFMYMQRPSAERVVA